jgi:hypothetical protein
VVGKLCQPDCSVYRCVYPDGSRLAAIGQPTSPVYGIRVRWTRIPVNSLSLSLSLSSLLQTIEGSTTCPSFYISGDRSSKRGRNGNMECKGNKGNLVSDGTALLNRKRRATLRRVASDPMTVPITGTHGFVIHTVCVHRDTHRILPRRVVINKSPIVHICVSIPGDYSANPWLRDVCTRARTHARTHAHTSRLDQSTAPDWIVYS